jgi:hypothetical protein
VRVHVGSPPPIVYSIAEYVLVVTRALLHDGYLLNRCTTRYASSDNDCTSCAKV